MAKWTPPTMADLEPNAPNWVEKAPCCRRRVQSTELVQNPDADEVGEPPYLCGACREARFLKCARTREDFIQRLGGPAEARDRVRPKDISDAARQGI